MTETIDQRLTAIYQDLCSIVRTLNTIAQDQIDNPVAVVNLTEQNNLLNSAASIIWFIRTHCTYNIPYPYNRKPKPYKRSPKRDKRKSKT